MNFFVDSLVGGQAAASQRPVARQPRPPWSRSSGTWILKGARRHVLRLPRALATRRERPALATPSAVVPGPVPPPFTPLPPERLALATTPLSSRNSLDRTSVV